LYSFHQCREGFVLLTMLVDVLSRAIRFALSNKSMLYSYVQHPYETTSS
jgi:hypothetical protein